MKKCNDEGPRWITLYSILVYCHGARGCSVFLAQFHTTFIVKYHTIVITIYLRPQTRYFMHQPDRVRCRIDLPEHSHTHFLYAVHNVHTAADKRRKSILCLIYIHTRPTRLRLPLLPNSRFCAHFYTLPYNIYNIHNFTPDVIIRDLPHHFPATDCPHHLIPPRFRSSPPSFVTSIL